MTAYDASELMAAKAEQEAQERYDAKEAEREQYEEACTEYATVCWEDDGDLQQLMEEFYASHDDQQIAYFWDHVKQERKAASDYMTARNDEAQEEAKLRMRHHNEQIINWLARAVDRGCLLEDEGN